MVISWPAAYDEVQGVRVFSIAQPLVAADELAVVVADQRAGQQVGLAEDLEAVADAEHRHPAARRAATTSVITGAKREIAPQRR